MAEGYAFAWRLNTNCSMQAHAHPAGLSAAHLLWSCVSHCAVPATHCFVLCFASPAPMQAGITWRVQFAVGTAICLAVVAYRWTLLQVSRRRSCLVCCTARSAAAASCRQFATACCLGCTCWRHRVSPCPPHRRARCGKLSGTTWRSSWHRKGWVLGHRGCLASVPIIHCRLPQPPHGGPRTCQLRIPLPPPANTPAHPLHPAAAAQPPQPAGVQNRGPLLLAPSVCNLHCLGAVRLRGEGSLGCVAEAVFCAVLSNDAAQCSVE